MRALITNNEIYTNLCVDWCSWKFSSMKQSLWNDGNRQEATNLGKFNKILRTWLFHFFLAHFFGSNFFQLKAKKVHLKLLFSIFFLHISNFACDFPRKFLKLNDMMQSWFEMANYLLNGKMNIFFFFRCIKIHDITFQWLHSIFLHQKWRHSYL